MTERKMVLLPVSDEVQVQPTLERAAKDVRRDEATIKGLTFTSVTVAYVKHPTYGTEEFEFEGCTIAQLVPFSEALLRSINVAVPTVQCPKCTGRNLRNCPVCNGLGKVLASQVTSEQAAQSPSLAKYRDR